MKSNTGQSVPDTSNRTKADSPTLSICHSDDYKTLFQNSTTLRTVNFLAHFLDSRLSPNWRNELNRWYHATDSDRDPRIYSIPSSSDVIDGTNPESGIKTLGSTDVQSSSQIHSAPNKQDVSVLHSVPCTIKPSTAHKLDVPSTFVSRNLVMSAINLCNRFESRYQSKLGNLLEDVAHMDNVRTTTTVNASPDRSNSPQDSMDNSIDDVSDVTSRDKFFNVLNELFTERINWGRIIAMLTFLRALCEISSDQVVRPQSQLVGSLETEITTTPSTDDAMPMDEHCANIQHGHYTNSLECSEQSSVADRPCAADYVVWATKFIHESPKIWSWIQENENWEGLITFEAQIASITDNDRAGVSLDDETVRLLKRALASVATIAVGAVGLMAAYRYLSSK